MAAKQSDQGWEGRWRRWGVWGVVLAFVAGGAASQGTEWPDDAVYTAEDPALLEEVRAWLMESCGEGDFFPDGNYFIRVENTIYPISPKNLAQLESKSGVDASSASKFARERDRAKEGPGRYEQRFWMSGDRRFRYEMDGSTRGAITKTVATNEKASWDWRASRSGGDAGESLIRVTAGARPGLEPSVPPLVDLFSEKWSLAQSFVFPLWDLPFVEAFRRVISLDVDGDGDWTLVYASKLPATGDDWQSPSGKIEGRWDRSHGRGFVEKMTAFPTMSHPRQTVVVGLEDWTYSKAMNVWYAARVNSYDADGWQIRRREIKAIEAVRGSEIEAHFLPPTRGGVAVVGRSVGGGHVEVDVTGQGEKAWVSASLSSLRSDTDGSGGYFGGGRWLPNVLIVGGIVVVFGGALVVRRMTMKGA